MKNGKNIGGVFSPLVEQLKIERVKMPRVIIYCQRCEECALIYHFFLELLKEFTEPIGTPNLSGFRLVHFYMGVTRKDVQDTIIQSFSRAHAPLRIVVCTVPFGMGVDCVGVMQVIYWGPASDIETYIQECGRAGSNGETSSAAVLYKTRSGMKRVSSCMKQYCVKNDVCRRVILCSYFDTEYDSVSGCACCDVCATSCSCNDCKCK